MDIPTLETERLLLVPPRLAHLRAYHACVSDPEFSRHLEQTPMDLNTADRTLAAMVGHWHLRGCGSWIVEDKQGAFIGRVGHNAWEIWPELELGWWIGRERWGNGYAVEAARAVLEHTWKSGRTRVVSFIRPVNTQSIRVAEKLGAKHERNIPFLGGESRVYVHSP
jgi:[ribosomal protein S5]-alanine N-acetyltransferase